MSLEPAETEQIRQSLLRFAGWDQVPEEIMAELCSFGEIIEVNEILTEDPAQVNADPYGEGWFMRIRIDDPSELEELMDEEAYKDFLADLE